MKELVKIFLTFAKIGVMTFGGGYSMLPMLKREVVENRKWTTENELLDYFAIGQTTPGIIAVNTATFIGYYHRGIAGAAAAALGVIFPSVVIITLLAALIQGFYNYPVLGHALTGITAAVAVLILNSVIMLWKKGIKDGLSLGIFIAALALTLIFDLPSAWLVAGTVVLAVLTTFIKRKREGRR